MTGNDGGSSVAIVVLDTLRKDTFDRHFDWVRGKRFENAWSTSHWTVPAHASLFTGEYASDAGCYARSPTLDHDGPVLAELLSGAGYSTRGFSANRHVTPRFEFDRGFDEFVCVDAAADRDERVPSRRDYFTGPTYRRPVQLAKALVDGARGKFDPVATAGEAYKRLYEKYPHVPGARPGAAKALSFVRDREFGDREFLFLNLMDVHAPYKPPVTYQSRWYSTGDLQADVMATFSGESIEGTGKRAAYEDCARYLSDVAERIVDELDGFDYVVVLSDHGESFGENGVWAHPVGLHPALTHVPVVIRGPDVVETEVETPVNLLDVFATVVDLAGVEAETAGHSLLGDPTPGPKLTEFHGLLYDHMVERVEQLDIPDGRAERFDEPRGGIALPPDYYGYESMDGFESTGDAGNDSPRDVLERLKAEREPIDRGGTTLRDDVETQLRQLGYL